MFAVNWYERGLNEFTDIYITLDLETQRRVAGAVEALIRRLEREPLAVGESRSGNSRIAFIDRLAVRFSVAQFGRSVRIYSVKRYGR